MRMNEIEAVNIVIPSYKRAGAVKGYRYFRTARIVIPESQADDYRAHYDPARLIVIPDEADGNIARKRNWILRNVPRPLVMIDDDVRAVMMTEGKYDAAGKFIGGSAQRIRLTPAQAENLIVNGFNLAYSWGCPLWGLNVNTDGRNYQQYKPFSLTLPILGPFQGHLEHDLLCDERLDMKDDYDFSLQALNKYRKILRMNKYAYDCAHADNKGGIVAMRTMKRETDACRAIERKWGRDIIRYPLNPKKQTELLNGVLNVPIAGV